MENEIHILGKFGSILLAITVCLATSCSTLPTRRAEASAIVRHNKAELSSEFIGIADGKAFKLVRLIPLFGGHPKEVIWWCPTDELTPAEIASLRPRAGRHVGSVPANKR